MSLKFALVAGEHSGDQLGAGLIEALRMRLPGARFVGVAGPKMTAAGCETWVPAERLAVMGFFEVLSHLPGLFRLRRLLVRRLRAEPPDVFIGIDAPEFNLGLARQLHKSGIPTVQYVSPQVWAWRQGRVRSIAESVDLILCLLPFEQNVYREAGVRTEFVGHPLADDIPLEPDRSAARKALGLGEQQTVAVLPGSRRGEVERLGDDFAATVALLHRQRPQLQFVAPMANPTVRGVFEAKLASRAPGVPVRVVDSQAQAALAAADAVLVASGTATLETTLSKRPMTVAYRINALTAWLLRRFKIVKTRFFSQPNLLAGKALVPELFQEQVTPEALSASILGQLDDAAGRERLVAEFTQIHRQLRRDASARAAEAILNLLSSDAPGSSPPQGGEE